jgi:hypothetical protein
LTRSNPNPNAGLHGNGREHIVTRRGEINDRYATSGRNPTREANGLKRYNAK